MSKIVFLSCICLLVTTSSFAQIQSPVAPAPIISIKSSHPNHAQIHRAIRKLRGARLDLQKSPHDYNGHKTKAIAAINAALMELEAALDKK